MALIFDNVNNQIIDSNGNVIAPLDLSLVVQNAGGAPSIKEGLFADLPATANTGALYVAQDTKQLIRFNGATWDVIGAAGAGTVTSVALSAPPQFAVSGTPVTTTGTLALAWNTQSANKIFAGPSTGVDALPTFRNLTAADLPSFTVPWANVTGTPTTLGGYGITNAYSRVEVDALNWSWSHITGTPTTLTGYGITDGVRSVDGSGGTTGLTLSGGPITGTGTLTLGGTLSIANGGTGQTTANAALNALLPTQAGANSYVLATDGTNTLWTPQSGGGSGSGPTAVRFATTTTLPSYTASGSGLGKTLTGTAATALTIDGATPLVVGDRILVKDETSTAKTNNGIYTVTRQGTGASGVPEVTTITVPATLPSKTSAAILISSPTVDYYFWLVPSTGAGADPAPTGRTQACAASWATVGYNATTFATNLKNQINSQASAWFTATSSGSTVTITAVANGPAKTAPSNDPRTANNIGATVTVATPGSAAVSYILTRASDFVSSIKSGALVPVVLGDVNADTLWMLTTDGTITIDTTQLTFQKTNATSGGVTSFNTRTGSVTLTSGDVTTALTYTPYNATNPSGYITSAGTATNVSGVVAIANGGTGLNSVGTANKVLGVANAGGTLEYKTITAGANVTVTHSAGAITIASTATGVTSVQASGGTTGLAFTGGPITGTGTLTLSGTLAIANGGTGQTTAAAAFNALVPSQTGKTGKYLISDGTNTSWVSAPSVLPVRVATTANLSVTAAGTGATKTLTQSGFGSTMAIDGVTLATGDRVLVKDQSTGSNNGVYSVTTDGTATLAAQVLTFTITQVTGLAGSCIYWSDPYNDHYFWFTNDGAGGNPSPAGRVSPGPFNVVSGTGVNTAATDFCAFINSTSGGLWTATVSTNVITLTATNGVKGPALNPASNGVPSTGWTITTVNPGSGSQAVLTRASDYNTNPVAGQLIPVVAGTVNAGTTYRLTTQNAVLDTTALVYSTGVSSSGTVTSVQASGGTTGLSFSGGPITGSGTLTLAGTLNVANGGTGAVTLTGYVKASGTSAMTASATIPTSDLSGSIDGGTF